MARSIYLRSLSEQAEVHRFHILSQMGERGASAVCYHASPLSGSPGILKEYAPIAFGRPKTTPNGQPCLPEDPETLAAFRRMMSAYTRPYRLLVQRLAKEENRNALGGFLPPVSIYEGCDPEGNVIGPVYIWMPMPEVRTFKSICGSIREHSGENALARLTEILYCIRSLAECVFAMHGRGLLLCDITPGNYGYAVRNGKTLYDAIQIFDLDAVQVVTAPRGEDVSCKGTPGFYDPTSPEPSVRSDVYAVGANLWYAAVLTPGTAAQGYRFIRPEGMSHDALCAYIKKCVGESALVKSLGAFVHPYLVPLLVRILQNTLCEKEKRYPSCKMLLADLSRAIGCLGMDMPGETVTRERVARSLRDAGKQDSAAWGQILLHLWKHPFFQPDDPDIRLALLGFGKYGQMFLDTALQAAQVPSKRLYAAIISENSHLDRESYCSGSRPAFRRFFDTGDGRYHDPDAPYGTIHFAELHIGEDDATRQYLAEMFADAGTAPRYVFVSLGSDRLNLLAAGMVRRAADAAGVRCMVSLAMTGDAGEYPGFLAVPVSVPPRRDPEFAVLEQMGLNTHRVWSGHLNQNQTKLRREFREPYNYRSCLSFVVCARYKLLDMGIPLSGDMETRMQAAGIFRERCTDGETGENLHKLLVWCEHRRWVTEKICAGFDTLSDLESCAYNEEEARDRKHSLHGCLLRSRPEQPLETWTEEQWDTVSPDAPEFLSLDPLDRMSVSLHQMYLRHAEQICAGKNLLEGDAVKYIQAHISHDRKAVSRFEELLAFMRLLWNRRHCRYTRYTALRGAFESCVRRELDVSAEVRELLLLRLHELCSQFQPVYSRNKYHDYKNEDKKLTGRIPFIITYSDRIRLVVPFRCGSVQEIFGNAAAVTAVNPERVYYYCLCRTPDDIANLTAALRCIGGYMEYKDLRASVELLLGCVPGLTPPEELPGMFGSRQRFRKITVLPAGDETELASLLYKRLRRHMDGKTFLAEQDGSPVSRALLESIPREVLPAFAYDSTRQRFQPVSTSILDYLQVSPVLSVQEMLSFRLSHGSTSATPEFYSEYTALWEKYCENPEAWKTLCRVLSRDLQERQVLAAIRRTEPLNPENLRFLLPFAGQAAAQKIIGELVRLGLIGAESSAGGHTSTSCAAQIIGYAGDAGAYRRVFSCIAADPRAENFSCIPTEYGADIRHETLSGACGGRYAGDEDIRRLLFWLEQEGFLLDVRPSSLAVTFTYATAEMQQLLTDPRRIMEVYVCHTAQAADSFDDFRCGLAVAGGRERVSLLLTKQFSSWFVGCADAPQENDYRTLRDIALRYGVNATCILLADTKETAALRKLRRAWEKYGILTVCGRKALEQAAAHLSNLFPQHEK